MVVVVLGACGTQMAQGDTPGSAAVSALARAAAVSPHLAAAVNQVAVSPFPGTPDASPTTQISFVGPSGTSVSDVRVVGSSTGAHSGRLEKYSTGTGESFLVSRPFQPGEMVSVSATVAGSSVRTQFTIAHQASVDERPFPANPGDPAAVQHYRSAPDLSPSTVTITTPARSKAAPGDLFLAPYQGRGTPGPMISDQSGNLIWFHPLPAGMVATNFQALSYQGKPALVWWQGRVIRVGFGQGEDVIYNRSYQPVATIRAGNGYMADLHEIRIEPDGTAWIDIFDPIELDLSAYGGSAHGILLDSVVQHIDIKTGLVMWEWHAYGHVALSDSHLSALKSGYPWDFVHLNSVDPGSDGDVLFSMRNTWGLYDVDLHTGAIRWRLGDDHSTIHAGPGVRFYWQHDAEWQPDGRISVLDNGSTPPEEKQTRGLVIQLDAATHTATLKQAYTNPTKTLLSPSQANLLSLPNGNWLMGYGTLPNFTEFDSAGHVLLDGTLGKNVQDFRTYLAPWTATPTTTPNLATQRNGDHLTAWVSWNGATNITRWQLLAGQSPGSLSHIGAATPRHGFETTITATTSAPILSVEALDATGHTLATSRATKVHTTLHRAP
jgi:hypothetical protein